VRLIAAVATCLILLAAPAAAAPEDVANDISNEIMSPFCDGVTLHDCPSQEALDLGTGSKPGSLKAGAGLR